MSDGWTVVRALTGWDGGPAVSQAETFSTREGAIGYAFASSSESDLPHLTGWFDLIEPGCTGYTMLSALDRNGHWCAVTIYRHKEAP